jgi:hypothetical protein
VLKISQLESPHERRLVLEGKLVTPWTTELQSACEEARKNLEGREFVVDLKNLTVISQEGETLLAALMHEGVKFHGCGVYARQVLWQLARSERGHHQEEKS